MFAYMLTSKPCSETTNIQDSFSSVAVFDYWSIARIYNDKDKYLNSADISFTEYYHASAQSSIKF